MKKLLSICFLYCLVFSLAHAETSSPGVLHFPVKIIPQQHQVAPFMSAQPQQGLFLYNDREISEGTEFSLQNPQLLEALLANGHELQGYYWLRDKDNQPFRGMFVQLIKYNPQEKLFVAESSEGKITISEQDCQQNLRFVQVVPERPEMHNWYFATLPNEQSRAPQKISVKASNFQQALQLWQESIQWQGEDSSQTPWALQVVPLALESSSSREQKISIPFRMEIKKKKLKSKGCGGFIWWPVGAKSFDIILWDEEEKGVFLYFDPTKPVDYPTYNSKNYIHNKHWQCHPCSSSKMVPGVWVNFRFSGDRLTIKIVKYSTCNIGTGHWDEYGNATAVVAGIANCWVEKK